MWFADTRVNMWVNNITNGQSDNRGETMYQSANLKGVESAIHLRGELPAKRFRNSLRFFFPRSVCMMRGGGTEMTRGRWVCSH